MKAICALSLLLVWMAETANAGQQPTEPGWPQPVVNNRPFAFTLLDQNELRTGSGSSLYRWDGESWYGGNIDRAWIKSEGKYDIDDGRLDEAEVQALFSHAISSFFNLQAGARYDFQPAPSRGWAAIGIQGLAPLFWEVSAFAFIGTNGRLAGRLDGRYDLLMTQRLILESQFEVNFYAQNDPATGAGSGLSDLDAGLRLRYEIRREFAPYVGVSFTSQYGQSAAFARARGESVRQILAVAGIRASF